MLARPRPVVVLMTLEEQAHRLARAHRHREDAAGGEQDQPEGDRGAAARGAESIQASLAPPASVRIKVARHSSSSACSATTRAVAEPLVERELRPLPAALRLGALGAAGRGDRDEAAAAVGAGADLDPAVGDQRLQVARQRRGVHLHRARRGRRAGPGRAASTCESSEYWVVFSPVAPTIAVVVLADAARQLAQLEVGAALRLDGGGRIGALPMQ